jgi:hypothetical protein
MIELAEACGWPRIETPARIVVRGPYHWRVFARVGTEGEIATVTACLESKIATGALGQTVPLW